MASIHVGGAIASPRRPSSPQCSSRWLGRPGPESRTRRRASGVCPGARQHVCVVSESRIDVLVQSGSWRCCWGPRDAAAVRASPAAGVLPLRRPPSRPSPERESMLGGSSARSHIQPCSQTAEETPAARRRISDQDYADATERASSSAQSPAGKFARARCPHRRRRRLKHKMCPPCRHFRQREPRDPNPAPRRGRPERRVSRTGAG